MVRAMGTLTELGARIGIGAKSRGRSDDDVELPCRGAERTRPDIADRDSAGRPTACRGGYGAGGGGGVAAAGLCHTDLEVIEGQLVYPMPIVLGHEAAGVIASVGSGVDPGRVGQR